MNTKEVEIVADHEYVKTFDIGEKLSAKLDALKSYENDAPNRNIPSLVSRYVTKELDIIDVEYKCSKCPEIFHSAAEYVSHLDTHRTQFCKLCQIEIPIDEYRDHNKKHKRGSCDYCGMTLKSMDSLRQHIYRIHQAPRIICEICGIASFDKDSHESHVRRIHTGIASHVCEICGEKFCSAKTVSAHVKALHSKHKPFKCDDCDKAYTTKAHLKQHQLKHSTHKSHVCEFCGKGFKLLYNLRTHQKNVHKFVEKCDFNCNFCEKVFPTFLSLSVHCRIHAKQTL